MKFLDDLRAHLERPEPPPTSFVPDVGMYRRRLIDRLKQLENQPVGRADVGNAVVRQEQLYWSGGNLDVFLKDLVYMLRSSLAWGANNDELARLVSIAFDRSLFLETSTGSLAEDLELDQVSKAARQEWGEGRAPVETYARKMHAVRRNGEHKVLTPIGRLILELPEKDALRWLLSVEVTLASEDYDPWHLSKTGAMHLLGRRALPHGWLPVPYGTLERLSLMNILRADRNQRNSIDSWEVLPQGRFMLEEIASASDTPLTLLARAMLQDETAAVLGQSPAALLVGQENAAAVATRHARMVAHEIRNALVPLQGGLRNLYESIEQSGRPDIVESHREPIDAGVARIFRFVRDIAKVADLATTSDELFDPAQTVEVALAAVRPETGDAVEFVKEAELPQVLGHRERFVLVLVNLLRNAAQARREPPVRIRVTAGTNNGAEVFVRVDDDGPGVADADRARIFAHGFSRRPGGSGQGLAFVREVVETEMVGRVAYEQSPLGGARFVVRLPVGTRRSG